MNSNCRVYECVCFVFIFVCWSFRLRCISTCLSFVDDRKDRMLLSIHNVQSLFDLFSLFRWLLFVKCLRSFRIIFNNFQYDYWISAARTVLNAWVFLSFLSFVWSFFLFCFLSTSFFTFAGQNRPPTNYYTTLIKLQSSIQYWKKNRIADEITNSNNATSKN